MKTLAIRLSPPQPAQTLRLVCLSDTHGRHREISVPPGDLLLHAGDFTHFGHGDMDEFDDWLASLPHKHKIIVRGNHEHKFASKSPRKPFGGHHAAAAAAAAAARKLQSKSEGQVPRLQVELVCAGTRHPLPQISTEKPQLALKNATVLEDSTVTVAGLRIHGLPFSWSQPDVVSPPKLPLNTDILLVHGPPLGLCDGGHGCPALRYSLNKHRPRLVVCGHIHYAHGVSEIPAEDGRPAVLVVNAAQCGQG